MKEIKKILLINHGEADYLESDITLGLVKLLGVENVILFPFKPSYAGETHIYPSPYGKNSLGSREFWDEMDVWADQKKGVTGPYEFFPAIPFKKYNFDDIYDTLDSIDLIILTSPRCWVSAHMTMLQRTGKRLPPCVMIDGEDNIDIRFDYINAFDPVRYFKREYTLGMQKNGGDRFLPFPLCSYVWESKFAAEAAEWMKMPKEYDVFMVVGETNPYRKQVYEAVASLRGKYNILAGIGSELRYNTHDYLKKIALSKIGISVKGFGEDTVRHWEIPSFNTLLLSDQLTIIRPHPFIEGQTASCYSSPKECAEKIEYWLSNNEELKRVAKAGQEHCMKFHTCEARARQLITEVEKVI